MLPYGDTTIPVAVPIPVIDHEPTANLIGMNHMSLSVLRTPRSRAGNHLYGTV